MIYDIRSYRIPNPLVLIGICIGSVHSFYSGSWNGLFQSMLGIVFPITLLIILHRLRMLGAGDIKLFAVIGGSIGFSVWKVMLYSFIAGGVLAAIHMCFHQSLVSRMKWFWNYIQSCLQTRQVIPYVSGFDQGNTSNTIHFSIAILIGYCCWLLERWVIT